MRSNKCHVCGTLGGGGTEDCINRLKHPLLLRSKKLIKKLQDSSYLYQLSKHETGHAILKKVLSNEVNQILEGKNKAPKSFHFKRKKYD